MCADDLSSDNFEIYNRRTTNYGNGKIEITAYHRSRIRYMERLEASSDRKIETSDKAQKEWTRRQLYAIRRKIKGYAFCNSFCWFVTLTFNPKKLDSTDYEMVKATLLKWCREMRDRHGQFAYLMIPELHKSGAVHFHGLLGNIPARFVKAVNPKTGEPIIRHDRQVYNLTEWEYGFSDCEEIESPERAATYITKYVTTALLTDKKMYNKKRYFNSQGLVKPVVNYDMSDNTELDIFTPNFGVIDTGNDGRNFIDTGIYNLAADPETGTLTQTDTDYLMVAKTEHKLKGKIYISAIFLLIKRKCYQKGEVLAMARKDNTEKLNLANILSANTADDIICTDNVLKAIMNAKKEKLLSKIHPYKITEPKSEGKRWQTYYRDANGERKIIRAQTKDALLEKLIPIYFQESHLDKLIFSDLFLEWLEYKKTVTDSPNTIKRHTQHYKRYFERSELHSKPVCQIDTLLLESECNRLVKEYSMSRKEWNNVKTILLGCFEYAVRKKYITVNPMNDVKILVKYRQVVKKTGKTETYNTEELEILNKYLDEMYSETEDTVFLAVKLNFLLGLRVGELVALKWEDCEEETHIHVVREEIRNQETNQYEVVEHTKTNRDRFVILIPKAVAILQKIPKQGKYIFMRDGERITSRQIAYVLEKFAERQGMRTKSTHKMRKTYASNLNANGVPLDCIREMLGHSNLSTTLGYIYNPLTEKETYDLITKAL